MGREGSWQLYIGITARHLRKQAGSAPYVPAAPRSYAYLPALLERVLAPASEYENRPFLKNEADPVRDLLGPGRLSHPQEWTDTISMLKREGVEVSYREGVMAYWAKEGEPGRITIDPECSITALWHETQHFLDDKALGYPGMGHFFENQDARWRLEFHAYMTEVRFVRGLREFQTGEQLVQLARTEKTTIFKRDEA